MMNALMILAGELCPGRAARGERRVAWQGARARCQESDAGTAEAALLAAQHGPTRSTPQRERARSRCSDSHHGLLEELGPGVAALALLGRALQRALPPAGQRAAVQGLKLRSPRGGLLGVYLALVPLAVSCASREPNAARPQLHYVGSSTVANFLRDAEPIYGRDRFVLSTEPESAGGEQAILEGRCDLAGIAGRPRPSTLERGVTATLLGRDAIAILVHSDNPIDGLSLAQLRGVYTGEISNWKELGGPDLPIRALMVGPDSATLNVFRSAVHGEVPLSGYETVRPDSAIIDRVREDPSAIGPISLSFYSAVSRVKRLAIDGEEPLPTNGDYAITRPLYLLWWPGRERVAAFVEWTRTPAAESVLLRRFARGADGQSLDGQGTR